jgi:hypothetical protein
MNAATSEAFAIQFPAYRSAHAGYACRVFNRRPLRQKTNFLNPINLICLVQFPPSKIFPFPFPPNHPHNSPTSSP